MHKDNGKTSQETLKPGQAGSGDLLRRHWTCAESDRKNYFL